MRERRTTSFEQPLALVDPLRKSHADICTGADLLKHLNKPKRPIAERGEFVGLHAPAMDPNREAAGCYGSLPTALSASIQIAHAHRRLGQPADAAAALARVRWLLVKIPSSAFEEQAGQPSKEEWRSSIDRIEQSGLY